MERTMLGIEKADFDSVMLPSRAGKSPYGINLSASRCVADLEMDGWNNTTSGDGFCCVLLSHAINPPVLTLHLDNTCAPLTGIAARSLMFPFIPCAIWSLSLNTDKLRRTTGKLSEECFVRRFRHYANVYLQTYIVQ